jgi:glycosyltransferase involved in cell wall biosynthesis
MRACAVIPTYRHVVALPHIAAALRAHFETVFIVDDGNAEPERSAIAALHAPENGVQVVRRDANGGKGAAMLSGFHEAIAQGFSHALQLDADGQHDVADLPKFIEAWRNNPKALICGQAVYSADVPKSRKFGRYITHFWVWVETFSFDVADSMCGFRIYPLEPVERIITRTDVGKRMDFDTEIVVRLHWRGVRVINIPTRVIYPQGNVSNFQMLADNVLISLMHTRLFLQAPFRVLWKLIAYR